MIAVTVSRVQAAGSELASAEDRAERQLNERVTTIAEDIIGELLHSRIKLAEPEQSVEQQTLDDEESETEKAKLKRSLSVSGPLTSAEVRRLEAARPFLLRRRPLRQYWSRVDNPTRRTMNDGLLKPPVDVSRPASPLLDSFNVRLSDTRRKTARPVSVVDAVDGPVPAGPSQNTARFSVFDSRASFESLHRSRTRKVSCNDYRESSNNVNYHQEETPFNLQESRPSAANLLECNDDDSAEHMDAKKRKRDRHKALYKHTRAAIWSSIGIIAYCLLGGLFVCLIEGPHEVSSREFKQQQHALFLQTLQDQLHINDSGDSDVTQKLKQLVQQFESEMTAALKSTVPDGEPVWTFVRSWFFSWTVITTIGFLWTEVQIIQYKEYAEQKILIRKYSVSFVTLTSLNTFLSILLFFFVACFIFHPRIKLEEIFMRSTKSTGVKWGISMNDNYSELHGYGNYTPVTQLGRVWVMVFGMVGIPLVVLNTMRFGRLFTQITVYTRSKLQHWFRKRLDGNSQTSKHDTREVAANYMPPWVAITLLPTYCAIMAGVFCAWEPWDYFDSFYFTFVTLAGIGLGDIAPSKEEVMILFTVFKMIGLGLFALFMEMGAIQLARLGKRVKQCGKVWASKTKLSADNKTLNQQSNGKQVEEA